jgi:hypothetical protein
MQYQKIQAKKKTHKIAMVKNHSGYYQVQNPNDKHHPEIL